MNVLTLVFLRRGDEVLLGYKKRGFGVGKWNGLGGKLEEGETIEESAKREVQEEVGIRIQSMKLFGMIECEYRNVEKPGRIKIHLFDSGDFSGEPIESDEIKPQWFNISEYPFDQAWADDRFWWPLYMGGRTFRGRFVFDGYDRIVEHELTEGF